jgi:AAA domain-containing protein
VQLLIDQKEIVGPRVRMLAPTGKARVRLGQETGQSGNVQTVAQFLLDDRFDPDTGRYYTNSAAPKVDATTCIVDESSMLTEDMLAAIVDALRDNCRLILVGDPYQLPPIGAGCPFVDIIEFLKREHHGKAVAELSTPRRQTGTNDAEDAEQALARSDVQLAAIFSGRDLPPGEDEIVVSAIEGKGDDTVKYRKWEQVSELPAAELALASSGMTTPFPCTIFLAYNNWAGLTLGSSFPAVSASAFLGACSLRNLRQIQIDVSATRPLPPLEQTAEAAPPMVEEKRQESEQAKQRA